MARVEPKGNAIIITQAGGRHRQDGSADGGLQRHRAYVDEPLVGAPKRNVELGRVPTK
jgi:hypothetical protein